MTDIAERLQAESDDRHDRRAWTDIDRIDLAYQTGIGPCLLIYGPDGQRLRHPLTPGETYALIRRLVSWLGMFHAAGEHGRA